MQPPILDPAPAGGRMVRKALRGAWECDIVKKIHSHWADRVHGQISFFGRGDRMYGFESISIMGRGAYIIASLESFVRKSLRPFINQVVQQTANEHLPV